MVECICCKKNSGNIRVIGTVIFYICGESTCRSLKGETVGEWLAGENYYFIEGQTSFILEINNKNYPIVNDKRVIKGLGTKIREILLKQSGN
jgi:hypothetical protein